MPLRSDYSALSFEGRSFEPIPRAQSQYVARPVWTWSKVCTMGMARMVNKASKRLKRKDSHAALDRGLNAALERRLKETPRDRQRAFGRRR